MTDIDHEYLPSHEQAELFMTTDMKRCPHKSRATGQDEQEQCENYEPEKDLSCKWWRPDFLGKNGGSICYRPWGTKKDETSLS